MQIMKKVAPIIGLFVMLCTVCTCLAQETVISGVVRDVNTHGELRAVNVYVKGKSIGTTTDISGRFVLRVPSAGGIPMIVFQHIAYFPFELSLDKFEKQFYVDLQPRVIPLKSVEVEGEGVRPEIEKDLPQSISVIEAQKFEIRGYVDAGDLLKTDQSVQIEEELSGQKTIAMRGGNSDEVIVLFNGVKMNNAYNNVFDLSLIDLEDVERLELIKGSNTALYGPEALGGVVNIVPKLQQDYNIRFQQRLGTYRSGNWGLHLHKNFNNLMGSYSFKRGGLSRKFVDVPEGNRLENASIHHTANLSYDFADPDGDLKGTLGGMWIYSTLDYDNQFFDEKLDNTNRLFSLKYSGELLGFQDIGFSASYKELQEQQELNNQSIIADRNIDDKALYFSVEKGFKLPKVDLLFSYQFQRNELDFLDERSTTNLASVGLESATLQRQHHGLVSILKYHGQTGSDFLKKIDLDVSVRHDRISDRQSDVVLRNDPFTGTTGQFDNNDWNETLLKFALNFSGYQQDFLFDGFLSFGANTKFPTLFQQISSPVTFTGGANQPNLSPEHNKSFELGLKLARDLREGVNIIGWQLSGNFFQNHYNNKFRLFTSPRIPVSFYDNVPNAKISGFEGKSTIFLLKKKVSVDLGISKYFISDKAAFPFKSDNKRVLNLNIDHAGYSFQLHWFSESDQTGWLRGVDGAFSAVDLPDNTNLDLHLSKTFQVFRMKFFANASGRNLLNAEDVVLEGIAIRDRRFYLTLGAQY